MLPFGLCERLQKADWLVNVIHNDKSPLSADRQKTKDEGLWERRRLAGIKKR